MVLEAAGGNVLLLSDALGPASGGRAVSLALAFGREPRREAFGQVADGGRVQYPFEPQPWGAHDGELEDKYGVRRQVVQQ
ncbi:hypothetical protein VQ071_13305 [Cohnella sp. 56]